MKRTNFFYEVITDVSLTWGEFLILEEASKTHYDAVCQSIAANGFLADLRYRTTFDLAAKDNDLRGEALGAAMHACEPPSDMVCDMRLKWRDLDILCKISESPTLRWKGRLDLHISLMIMLRQMGVEQERINTPPTGEPLGASP
jgi:hypothetical protein